MITEEKIGTICGKLHIDIDNGTTLMLLLFFTLPVVSFEDIVNEFDQIPSVTHHKLFNKWNYLANNLYSKEDWCSLKTSICYGSLLIQSYIFCALYYFSTFCNLTETGLSHLWSFIYRRMLWWTNTSCNEIKSFWLVWETFSEHALLWHCKLILMLFWAIP